MSITDTKRKRLAVILAVGVAIITSVTYFNVHGTNLADRKAAEIEADARELVEDLTYEEVTQVPADDFVLRGVSPHVLGEAAAQFVAVWKAEKWGAGRCITAEWNYRGASSVTRADC